MGVGVDKRYVTLFRLVGHKFQWREGGGLEEGKEVN